MRTSKNSVLHKMVAAGVALSILFGAIGVASMFSTSLSFIGVSHAQDDGDSGNTNDGNDDSNTSDNGDTSTTQTTFEIPNPLQSENLIELANALINVLIVLSVPIFVIVVVYAGFLYTTSAGNENKVKTANKTLAYAAIGFAIILLSKSAVTIIDDIVSGDSSDNSTEQFECPAGSEECEPAPQR